MEPLQAPVSFIDRTKILLNQKPHTINISSDSASSPLVRKIEFAYPQLTLTVCSWVRERQVFVDLQNFTCVQGAETDLMYEDYNNYPWITIRPISQNRELRSNNQAMFKNGTPFPFSTDIWNVIFENIPSESLLPLRMTCHAWNRILKDRHTPSFKVQISTINAQSWEFEIISFRKNGDLINRQQATIKGKNERTNFGVSKNYVILNKDDKGTVELLDPSTLKTQHSFKLKNSSVLTTYKIFGNYLVYFGNKTFVINLSQPPKGDVEPLFNGKYSCRPVMSRNLLFVPRDDTSFLNRSSMLEVWNVDTKEKVHEIMLGRRVNKIAICDDKCFIAHTEDEMIYVWEMDNPKTKSEPITSNNSVINRLYNRAVNYWYSK